MIQLVDQMQSAHIFPASFMLRVLCKHQSGYCAMDWYCVVHNKRLSKFSSMTWTKFMTELGLHGILLQWKLSPWIVDVKVFYFPYFLLLTDPSSECRDGQTRLVNSSIATNNYNGTEFNVISGLIEVCNNGSWLTICYNESERFTEVNMKVVNQACQSMGYGGKWIVFGILIV